MENKGSALLGSSLSTFCLSLFVTDGTLFCGVPASLLFYSAIGGRRAGCAGSRVTGWKPRAYCGLAVAESHGDGGKI